MKIIGKNVFDAVELTPETKKMLDEFEKNKANVTAGNYYDGFCSFFVNGKLKGYVDELGNVYISNEFYFDGSHGENFRHNERLLLRMANEQFGGKYRIEKDIMESVELTPETKKMLDEFEKNKVNVTTGDYYDGFCSFFVNGKQKGYVDELGNVYISNKFDFGRSHGENFRHNEPLLLRMANEQFGGKYRIEKDIMESVEHLEEGKKFFPCYILKNSDKGDVWEKFEIANISKYIKSDKYFHQKKWALVRDANGKYERIDMYGNIIPVSIEIKESVEEKEDIMESIAKSLYGNSMEEAMDYKLTKDRTEWEPTMIYIPKDWDTKYWIGVSLASFKAISAPSPFDPIKLNKNYFKNGPIIVKNKSGKFGFYKWGEDGYKFITSGDTEVFGNKAFIFDDVTNFEFKTRSAVGTIRNDRFSIQLDEKWDFFTLTRIKE